ncbi:UNVERIFIED_CONTAM: hypothetical protein Slati_2192500 [Sesamum latifolium]|uniref:Uncharacterized protein n=1 Tax=Sesamum latifolium TaxID=2727402 RepID=A0AAW2WT66_9LAMI
MGTCRNSCARTKPRLLALTGSVNKVKRKASEEPNPDPLRKEIHKRAASGCSEDLNSPRKGVIHMIAGGSMARDSHKARKTYVRKMEKAELDEVFDVEVIEDDPII